MIVAHHTTGYRRYSFRNPNVVSLLGPIGEIEQVLYKDREVPKLFEASSYRARFGDDRDSHLRGPLTYEQEGQLQKNGGISVIYGCGAANIEDVSDFLDGRIERGLFREMDECMTDRDLERRLTRLRPDIHRGTHLYVVPYETHWSLRWVERASDAWQRSERRRYIRLVFLADPTRLWQTLTDAEDNENFEHRPTLSAKGSGGPVDWIGVGPWNDTFLRRWCDDNNLSVEQSSLQRLMDISGGWPIILKRLAQSNDKNTQQREKTLNAFVDENTARLLDYWALSGSARREFDKLIEYEAYTTEEVSVLAEQLPADEHFDFATLNRRLTWAKLLGLLSETAGTWTLNPLLHRLLTKGSLS